MDRQQLEMAIAAQEALRDVVADEIVDATDRDVAQTAR